MSIRRKVFGAALGCLVLASGAATASDQKNYPASTCVRYAGASASYMYYDGGAVYNNHTTSDMYVDCPLVKDDIAGKLRWARVYFKNRHPSGMRCATITNWPSGSSMVGDSQTIYDYDQSSSFQSSYFGDDLNSATNAQYFISCRIQEKYSGYRSGVSTLLVNED